MASILNPPVPGDASYALFAQAGTQRSKCRGGKKKLRVDPTAFLTDDFPELQP